MFVNVPSLSASARSSGRVDKRWQSFLNYQLSTTKLAAAQGPGRLAGSLSGGAAGAAAIARPLRRSGLAPYRGQQQQHSGRVEQKRNPENEPSQDRLVAGADERRQIPHRVKVGLSFHRGLLDLQVGRRLRLDRKLVGRLLRLACRRASFAARSLEIGNVLKVMAPN
jgi:hypothetical protein